MNRATVVDDIIVRIHAKGEILIGPIPKGVGLERLRWDGSQVVDLADLSQIWVVDRGNRFSLHCREIFRTEFAVIEETEISISQLVTMSYADRKSLINDNGTIRIRRAAELLGEAQAAKIAEVKTQAGKMIVAISPEWKQRNILARSVELTRKETLTTEEETEVTAIETMWAEIKAIRTRSDVMEAEIQALLTVEAVGQYTLTWE